MKTLKYILALYIVLQGVVATAQERPAWVQAKPSSMIYYTGVGMAKKSDKDYMKVAKQHALSDLISEIEVEISSNSLLKKQEVNFKYSESFAQEIKTQATANIEQYELVDTWSNRNEYWCYYQLDKQTYEQIVADRINTAVRKAYDAWTSGNSLLDGGKVSTAAEMYCKGLDYLAPYLNKNLTVSHQGQTIDIASELYKSVSTVFDGLAIACEPAEITMVPMQNNKQSIAVGVWKNNVPVRDVKLFAQFTKGDGSVAQPVLTNSNGVTEIVVEGITSKLANQTIKVGLDATSFGRLNSDYLQELLANATSRFPYTTISIKAETTPIRAFLCTTEGGDENIVNGMTQYVANYFDLVADEASADYKILITSEFKIGRKVQGELYDMVEIFATGTITIADLTNNTVLTSFGVNNLRSLAPGHDSEAKVRNTAAREVIKKLKPEFSKKMKELNLSPRTSQTLEREDVVVDPNMPHYEE
ncbi:MAG: LPP20 family lipoprotein [Muribaculaceae bacterium]|nr:LPP20 family lipoprotein [Muribaculaceae bacterium]